MVPGTSNNIKIDSVGNDTKIFINGNLEIDYIDREMSPTLGSNSIAMYSEDVYVLYSN